MKVLSDQVYEHDYLVELFLDMGEAMLYSGAEIGRVEDTLARMGRAYGVKKTEIFALTSIIFLTASFDDGAVITQTRRVVAAGQTNFTKIEQLNALSRKCCKKALTRDELHEEIEKINQNNIHKTCSYVGSVLAAAGFAVLFAGTLLDSLVSALFAVLICFISDILSSKMPNRVFYYFITSLIVGFGICLSAKAFPVLNADKIIIADIMVLVPGIALTGAAKNMLIGDTLSALLKLAECVVWTLALAFGFMIPLALLLGG